MQAGDVFRADSGVPRIGEGRLQRKDGHAQCGPQCCNAVVQRRPVALYPRDERPAGIGAAPDQDRLPCDGEFEVFAFEGKRQPRRSRPVIQERVATDSAGRRRGRRYNRVGDRISGRGACILCPIGVEIKGQRQRPRRDVVEPVVFLVGIFAAPAVALELPDL